MEFFIDPVKSAEYAVMITAVGRADLDIDRIAVTPLQPFAYALRVIDQFVIFGFNLHGTPSVQGLSESKLGILRN